MGRFSRLEPLVSIVTPTYNQAQFIEETIRSVKAQDYPHIEHLILDDASTDHTREILQRYEGTYAMRWSAQAHEGQAAQIRRDRHAGESEVRLVDPWRIRFVESVGCTVAT